MEKSLAYQIAEAVLSGQAAPAPEPVVPIDETRRELKCCELCGRNFTRPIGSKVRDCNRHGSRGFQ